MPEEKTVFVEPHSVRTFKNQWHFLDSIERIDERTLDGITELNDLYTEDHRLQSEVAVTNKPKVTGYPLPVCIRQILSQGVTFDQRLACFRLAVHLKRVGLPRDAAVATLMNWRLKNRPKGNKRIITPEEIEEQVGCAYEKGYSGYGCNEPVIESFCDPSCPVSKSGR